MLRRVVQPFDQAGPFDGAGDLGRDELQEFPVAFRVAGVGQQAFRNTAPITPCCVESGTASQHCASPTTGLHVGPERRSRLRRQQQRLAGPQQVGVEGRRGGGKLPRLRLVFSSR